MNSIQLRQKIENHSSYLEFLEQAQAFNPAEDVDYSWVKEQSVRELERLSTFVKDLDAKADWLTKFFGGGSGILALVFTYFLQSSPAWFSGSKWMIVGHFAPVLVALVVALALAIRVRSPDMLPDEPNTHKAAFYAEEFTETHYAMMRGVASEGLRIALNYKGKLLSYAHYLLIGSIWLVGFALILSAVR